MSLDDYDRNVAYSELHERYKRFAHEGSCFYCGDNDTTDDHVPALKVAYRLRGHDSHLNLLLVRSCARCNSSLGDIALLTPIERREYIQRTALPRQIASIEQELELLDQKREELLFQLERLRELTADAAESFSTFNELPIGFRFTLAERGEVFTKTSDWTYKGSSGSRVANIDAPLVWWEAAEPPVG